MTHAEQDREQTIAEETTEENMIEEVTTDTGDGERDELSQALAERDDYLEQLQRGRAEFINFRKRSEQERLRLGELFTANTLRQFLPVIDDFDRAMGAVPEKDQGSGWLAGISMIHQKLQGILERAGVEPIDALHKPFDPSVHEAVASEPGTSGGTVVEVYQKGYKLGDTLLRAAMVKTGDAATDTDTGEASEHFNA